MLKKFCRNKKICLIKDKNTANITLKFFTFQLLHRFEVFSFFFCQVENIFSAAKLWEKICNTKKRTLRKIFLKKQKNCLKESIVYIILKLCFYNVCLFPQSFIFFFLQVACSSSKAVLSLESRVKLFIRIKYFTEMKSCSNINICIEKVNNLTRLKRRISIFRGNKNFFFSFESILLFNDRENSWGINYENI